MPRNRIALIGAARSAARSRSDRLEELATLCSSTSSKVFPRQDARHRAVRPDRRLRRKFKGTIPNGRHKGADVVIVTAACRASPA